MAPLDDVLAYAARGWQCFPLKPKSKEPATRRGFYDATSNPATLRRWFERFPYNVGVRTGTASGIAVVDIDATEGFASLAELEFEHGRLPQTLASNTGNGRHYWFQIDAPIPCSTGKLGAGIDVKADLGYVATPQSIHPNGNFYTWIDFSVVPAPMPEWLMQLACKKPAPAISERALQSIVRPKPNGESDVYGRAALDREIQILSAALPGTRNTNLNRSAFKLFQLVAGGELDREDVERALLEACIANKLATDDGWPSVRATIQSGARAGMEHPRRRGTT
jgi:hypothetical protein